MRTIADAVSWLEEEAHRIIRASKREMKDGTSAFPPQVGIHYEAFWLRDYEYTLEGSIASYSDKELTDACRLFVRTISPNGAGVDCVNFGGTPIYKRLNFILTRMIWTSWIGRLSRIEIFEETRMIREKLSAIRRKLWPLATFPSRL